MGQWTVCCIVALVGLLLVPETVSGERILFFMGTSSHSHRVAMQPLANALAEKGHEVSFLTPIGRDKNTHPNLKEVPMQDVYKIMMDDCVGAGDISVVRRLQSRHYEYLWDGMTLYDIWFRASTILVESPQFKKFMKESKFDLVITDMAIREVAFAAAYKFGAKIMMFFPGGMQMMTDYEMFGIPYETSALPDWSMGSPYSWIPDHFMYTYNLLSWYVHYKYINLPRLDNVIRENLGEGIPPVETLLRNVDLVLLNEHFTSMYPRALPQFVIPVGGMHAQDSNGTLPEKLEKFISGSPDGFVYISFGSIINVTKLPEEVQQSLFDAVASFKNFRFLWKWESAIPANFPKNVFTMSWFPQQDVLAHPKCRGIVTQGGAMSFQQAVYHGVPLIVIPAWFDQPVIGRSSADHGIGIHLELSEITKENFQESLQQIIYNESYSKNVKEMSRRTKDRPMHPTDLGLWWTEYILRHDTRHLKSAMVHQYWWQRKLLDFWGTVLLVFLLVAYVLAKILSKVCKLLLRLFFGGKPKVKKH